MESPNILASPANHPRISHVGLLIVSQVARWSARLGFVVFAARLLGPSRFGVYALLLTLVEFLAVASGSGYADYLTREAAKDEQVGWSVGWRLVILRVVIAFPAIFLEVGVLRLLGYQTSTLWLAAGLGLVLVPRALSEAIQGVLRGTRRYGLVLLIDVAAGAVLLCGGSWLVLRGGELVSVVAVEVISAVIAALVSLAMWFRLRSPNSVDIAWRGLIRKTLVFNIYPFTASLYNRVDIVVLSKLAGAYATGVYSVAYRVFGPLQLIPYGVLYSLLPSVSRDNWGEIERRRLEKAMGLLLCLSFIIVLATAALSGFLLHLLLGEQYSESVNVLKIIIWAVIPMYMNYALNVGLLAAGQERVFLTTTSVCMIVNLVGNLIFIPFFSWRAAAALTIITELVLLAQNLYWIRRKIGGLALPFGMVRTSAAFGIVLIVAILGGKFISPVHMWSAALCSFLAYLYTTGLVSEFAAVWNWKRRVAL